MTIDEALKSVNKQRADLGAYQNRFEIAARELLLQQKTCKQLNHEFEIPIWHLKLWNIQKPNSNTIWCCNACTSKLTISKRTQVA